MLSPETCATFSANQIHYSNQSRLSHSRFRVFARFLAFSHASGFNLVSVLSGPLWYFHVVWLDKLTTEFSVAQLLELPGAKLVSTAWGSGLTHPRLPPKSARRTLLPPILLALVGFCFEDDWGIVSVQILTMYSLPGVTKTELSIMIFNCKVDEMKEKYQLERVLFNLPPNSQIWNFENSIDDRQCTVRTLMVKYFSGKV